MRDERWNREVGITDAVSLYVRNYSNFHGRSSRGAYWWWFLVNLLVLGVTAASRAFLILGLAFALFAIVPNLALAFRRLHDTNKGGAWLLVGFIPLIGSVALLYFMAQPGTPHTNDFGPDIEAGRE